jgi:hypothetical protein
MNRLIRTTVIALSAAVYSTCCAATWSEVTNPSGNSLNAVRYLNASWFIVGDNGTLLRSSAGTNWEQIASFSAFRFTASFTSFRFTDIAYGNGTYMIVTAGGSVLDTNPQVPSRYLSTDGTNWTPIRGDVDPGPGTSWDNVYTFDRLSFEQGDFVGLIHLNKSGKNSRDVVTGSSGGDWDNVQVLSHYFNVAAIDVTSGKGRIVVAGALGVQFNPSFFDVLLASSADGRSWTIDTSPDPAEWQALERGETDIALSLIAFTADQFIALGENKRAVSTDGITWTKSTPARKVTPLAFANGVFYGEDSGLLYSSLDGATWKTDGAIPVTFDHLTIANGRAVAISGSRLFTAELAPSVAAEPADTAAAVHQSATVAVEISGIGPFTYQWRKDGVLLAASPTRPALAVDQPTLTLDNVSPADAGLYDVVITSAAGNATSRAARLTINYSRLVNLSARANVGTGDDLLIAGFVLAGDGAPASGANWRLIVRGAGPALARLGVSSALVNPVLDIFHPDASGQQLVANNDTWSNLAPTDLSSFEQLAASVGAFAFDRGSNDAGLNLAGPQLNVNSGPLPYTALLRGVQSGTGIALAEIYDAAFVHTRLVNLSARAKVGTGDDVLIVGFVIGGNQPLTVLLRAVGPTLASQGIATYLPNPKLTIYGSDGKEVQNNDNWNQAVNLADLRTATRESGAFALNENSNDAAILVTLKPGVYTAIVTSVDGSPGVALAEIYDATSE